MLHKAFSYRDDPAVPRFDDTAPVIIFDGTCVLCSRGVQWMLARDPNGCSRFAAIQDDIPRALYAHYDLDAEAFDTFMLLSDGLPHTRWSGVVAAARTLPWPWRALAGPAAIMPVTIGNRIYDFVQRNRIAWFGRSETCMRPSQSEARRFLSGA